MAVSQSLKVIAGRYRLESLIGEGGMASVWSAKDLTLARPVAVKLLFARDERDHEPLVARFLREARIAASVQHRNVIQIVDFGTTEQGQPFMVMELLEGESLGDRIHRVGSLPLDETVHIASLTLRGLAAVHDAGIIHRDLKPDNVYLKEEGGIVFPKILDFGISRSIEPSSGRRSALTTRDGIIVGTPEYMSPEQARGLKDIDRRTDIYSMGVILYQMLTGMLPFHSENVGDLIIKIVTGTAPNPADLRSDVPEELCKVVLRALGKLPEDRFANAVEMQRALMAAAESALGNTLRRSLSDLPPPSTLVLPGDDDLPIAPRERPLLSQEFPLGTTGELDGNTLPRLSDPTGARPPESRLPTTDEFVNQFESKKPRPAWLLPLLAAGALAAGTLWLWPRAEPVETTTQVAPKVEAPTHVTMTLRNVPTGATITVDGESAGSTVHLPKDARPHTVIVTAPGKLPWQAVYTANADWAYDVTLEDVPVVVAEPIAKPGGTRKPVKRVVATKPGKQKTPGALRDLDF